MNRAGFTLVELIVVMAVAGILLGIATVNFKQMTQKSGIEAQTKMMYADLMTLRSQALLTKSPKSARISATGFFIYPNATIPAPTAAAPLRSLKYGTSAAYGQTTATVITDLTVVFDTMGMATLYDGSTPISPPGQVCVEPSNNPAALDAIGFETSRIKVGKRNPGSGCVSDNIVNK